MFEEIPVSSFKKDMAKYTHASNYENDFDISNWFFIMAFDNGNPIGALTIVGKTKNIKLLRGKSDACVLWDIRVNDSYKRQGIGQKLLNMAIEEAKKRGYIEMIIESQTNNISACKFYQRNGAIITKIDTNAYYYDSEVANEIQLIWSLKLN